MPHKIDPIAYELGIETGNYKTIGSIVSPSYTNRSEAMSPKGILAEIIEGSLLVNNKKIIHWPNYDYKFNPGCGNPKWLPFDNLLTVSCAGSLRIVDITTGKHAELDKGSKIDWFN